MDGVQACSSLEKLTIEFTDDSDNWCDAVCEMLIGHKNLKELQVGCSDHHSVCALLDSLRRNHTLEKLTIKGLRPWGSIINIMSIKIRRIVPVRNFFRDLEERSHISSELAKVLIQNKALKELDICNYELDLQGDISIVLCENCTLRKLSISVERGPELEAISKLLKRNKTLKVLKLYLVVEGASTIAEVMCENNTLEELHILGEIEGAHEAFATMLERNTSLRKLSMAWSKNLDHCKRTWGEEFAILSNALSQNKSLLQLKVYGPDLYCNSAADLETRKKCEEDARIQCTKKLFYS